MMRTTSQPTECSPTAFGQAVRSIFESLKKGIELTASEQSILRHYKCAVAELQAYSDTELAELGISRDDIFRTAIEWHSGFDHRQLRSVA